MSDYRQIILVQARARSGEAGLDLVDSALDRVFAQWERVEEPEDPEEDDAYSIFLGASPSSEWIEVTDEELETWEVPVTTRARELSTHLDAPVLAIATGDEGLGLQVFVRGREKGRWASEGGDDARLDPEVPDKEWHRD